MENQTHYVRLRGTDLEPVCGDRYSPDWTTAPDEVTCPECMEWIAAGAERAASGDAAEPAPIDGP